MELLLPQAPNPALQCPDHLFSGSRRHLCGSTLYGRLYSGHHLGGGLYGSCCDHFKEKGYKGIPGKYDWKNLWVCTLRALPSLSLIVVVIGGIIGGVFTATEGSAIAVIYALILGILYRNITLKSFWKSQ